ncbi:hypothetical protein MKS77_20185 [Acinetobacter baumannii]
MKRILSAICSQNIHTADETQQLISFIATSAGSVSDRHKINIGEPIAGGD